MRGGILCRRYLLHFGFAIIGFMFMLMVAKVMAAATLFMQAIRSQRRPACLPGNSDDQYQNKPLEHVISAKK